jgi:hypothetical protein
MIEVLGEHPDLKKSLEEAAAAPRSWSKDCSYGTPVRNDIFLND